MTHDELLARLLVTDKTNMTMEVIKWQSALYAVVELHKPIGSHDVCEGCGTKFYPCPTIKAIKKALE